VCAEDSLGGVEDLRLALLAPQRSSPGPRVGRRLRIDRICRN
jgi:hypothetical protein